MPAPSLPDAVISALTRLHDIPEEGFNVLLEATQVLCTPSGPAGFIERVSAARGIEGEDAADLLDAVLWIMAHVDERGHNLHGLIEDLAASPDLDPADGDRTRLTERLRALTEREAIRLFHKGMALSLEHDRVFRDARIVTDIRPVFANGVEKGPRAAVLTHSLILEFYQAGETGRIYVALDQYDLATMSEVIDRAVAKASALKGTLAAANISNLTME